MTSYRFFFILLHPVHRVDRTYLQWVWAICLHNASKAFNSWLHHWYASLELLSAGVISSCCMIHRLLYVMLTGCVHSKCWQSAVALHGCHQDNVRRRTGRRWRPYPFPCARFRGTVDTEVGIGLWDTGNGHNREGGRRWRGCVGPGRHRDAVWYPQHHQPDSPSPYQSIAKSWLICLIGCSLFLWDDH